MANVLSLTVLLFADSTNNLMSIYAEYLSNVYFGKGLF